MSDIPGSPTALVWQIAWRTLKYRQFSWFVAPWGLGREKLGVSREKLLVVLKVLHGLEMGGAYIASLAPPHSRTQLEASDCCSER